MKKLKAFVPFWRSSIGELAKKSESTLFDRNLLRRGDKYDTTLMWVLLCLLCFGLVMVYSASGAQAGLTHFERRDYFLVKQAQYCALGLAVSYLLMHVPLWRWQRWTKYLVGIALLSSLLVLIIGDEVNGARRWLPTPFGIKFQPSELFKFATIIYMADFFKRKVDVLHELKHICTFHLLKRKFNINIPIRILVVGIPIVAGCILISMTRDLGSIIVVAGIFFALLFLANMPKGWFWGAASLALVLGVGGIVTSEYRMRRVAVMWQPWNDPTGTGYQGLGSLLSFERGGLFGSGLGNAIFKRGFLPEAHTDFILAVIGEELGLLTVAVVILVYVWIIWRAFSIGKQARDLDLYFNSFIAVGVGVWIAAQAFINVGVNISLLPNKGLTLPLISYGGSSLVIMMIALTILLRVDFENRRTLRGFAVLDPRETRKNQLEKDPSTSETAEAEHDAK